jgi:hypothetical protein
MYRYKKSDEPSQGQRAILLFTHVYSNVCSLNHERVSKYYEGICAADKLIRYMHRWVLFLFTLYGFSLCHWFSGSSFLQQTYRYSNTSSNTGGPQTPNIAVNDALLYHTSYQQSIQTVNNSQ